MSNLRPFQIVLLGIFGVLAVIALIILSIFQAERNEREYAYGEKVIVWGPLSGDAFRNVFQEISKEDKAFNVVEYRQIDEDSFDTELVNAIAEGRSPDLIVLRSDAIVTNREKLYPIPYDSYPLRDFQDAFVDGAEIFIFDEGLYGIPFGIDPMILFWNRDLFSSNGLSLPPQSWENIVSEIVPRLTIRDTQRNIIQSGIAFGEYRNNAHGKETLLLLALQSGSRMITEDEKRYKVLLNEPIVEGSRAPLQATVQFFTDFSNVNSPLYSWNRALSQDKIAFLSGDLGIYFGMGSEVADIASKNPNLNFDVAMVPQGANATALRTYGDFYALAIPRAAKNAQGAYSVARILTNQANGDLLSSSLGLSSARRDVIAKGDENPFRRIIIESALIARSWLDPNRVESDGVFMQMIEDVVSNRSRIGESVADAVDRLGLLY